MTPDEGLAELEDLDRRDRLGASLGVEELGRLLDLAALHGFPRGPDDPCAQILPFHGGGSYPVQYEVNHAGRHYYLRWRYGFSLDVDDVTVLECDLDTMTTNEWTFRELTVLLAIVSDAIRLGTPLSELVFPTAEELLRHPRYILGRVPLYFRPDRDGFPHEAEQRGVVLEVRDYGRWYRLWERRERLLGGPPRELAPPGCGCGVPWLSCGVQECRELVGGG